jgi:hypothetical protein
VLIETSDRGQGWEGAVAAAGPLNAPRALHLAALLELGRQGMTAQAAADGLGLEGAERERLLAAADLWFPGP